MKAPNPNPYIPRISYEKPPLVGGFSSHSEKIACAEYLAEKLIEEQTGFKIKMNMDGKTSFDIDLRRAFFYATRQFKIPAGILANRYKTTHTSVYQYAKAFKSTDLFLRFNLVVEKHILITKRWTKIKRSKS